MIILEGIKVQELLAEIEAIIDRKLQEQHIKQKEPAWKYLTRKEVSEQLRISLPTLHEWTKLGWIPSYNIGKRKLYKSNEIDMAITGRKHKKFL